MRITSANQHMYIQLEDEYKKVINEQTLIVAGSGGGKTLFTEGIMEEFHKKGYIVLVLADPKNEIEIGFQMFEPKEYYHLNHLKKIGKDPKGKKVKLYHPYTSNIPREKLPEMNLFTFSLKDLGRSEWGLIAETDYDKEVVRLMINASDEINKEEGIFSFLHLVQDSIKGKGNEKVKKADWKNFGLEASSGTMKSISEISSYFKAFKRDLFLSKDSCSLNLNWKEIFADQESYHVFFSRWIKDEKVRDFVVLALIEGLLKNKDQLKKPVLIVIPEIRKLVPFKPEGHKIYLAKSIKNALSLIRSSGRGMSSLLDSQVYEDIDQDVRNSATKTFFGEIGGGSDLDKICKFYGYKRDIKEKLKSMPYRNSFLLVGKEDDDVFTSFFPSGCHAEPNYNFFEMYKRKGFPTKSYTEIHNQINKMVKEDEEKIRERIKKREKAEKERKEKEKAEKERLKQEKEEGEKNKEKDKIENKENLTDIAKGKLIVQIKKNNPKISKRKVCEMIGVPVGSKMLLDKWEDYYLKSLENEVPGLSDSDYINNKTESGYD